MEGKKKRGRNYSKAEKKILLELIKKYQNIIENKEYNTYMISKKREAWNSVCLQYNAVAASGFRTWQQLRHFYENLKQRSKKNIERRLQFYERSKEGQNTASTDKKEIKDTANGDYKSTLNNQDNQILATVALEVQPLSSPYDNAALYFGESYINTSEDESSSDDILIKNHNNDGENTHTTAINQDCIKPLQSTYDSNDRVKPKPNESNIKQLYIKAKLRNARLENKYLINKNKMEINKYKIEMQILKLRLKRLKSSCKH